MTYRYIRTIASVTLAAAGGLMLAACGGSAAPAAPAAPAAGSSVTAGAAGRSADPCSLLTQSEVSTAVGQPLGTGKKTALPGDCQWATADFSAAVSVTVGDWSAWKTAATSGSHQPVSVPGIGDGALNINGANGSLLYVRKGSIGFLVTINGPHIDSLRDHGLAQEKVLAAAILGRL
jgi:hypothetical protein